MSPERLGEQMVAIEEILPADFIECLHQQRGCPGRAQQRAVRRLLAQGEVLLLIPGPPVDDVEKECEVREQGDGGQECGRHGGSI